MIILPLPDTLSGTPRVNLDIQRVDYASLEASGKQSGVQAGFPVWIARLEFDQVDPVSADLWTAFVDSLEGRLNRFYCGDPSRPRPIAHTFGMTSLIRAGGPDAGATFDGAASSWSQSIDPVTRRATITLTGLPEGFTLSPRDLIGFKWDAEGAEAGSFERRTLARCATSAVADAAGVISVIANPPLNPALLPAGAIAHLDDPVCVMSQVTEQTELGPIGAAGTMNGGTIVGLQDLRP
ncbi:MAG: hypothetical protein CL949_12805 [Erythrobacter sp.]|nr:hypothetical protein [Erythrobacter sp.]